MHSTKELSSDEFEILIRGAPSRLTDLFPDFDEQARLGVVIRKDFGAIGASSLLMSAVTGFYDIQRAQNPDGFFRYADYYLFHIGRPRGHFYMLEIEPDSKELVVPDDPESIIRAINDRGITHLVVPEATPREPGVGADQIGSALARLRAAYVYSPSGRVDSPDIEIIGNDHVDDYVWAVVNESDAIDKLEAEGGSEDRVAYRRSRLGDVPVASPNGLMAERRALKDNGRSVETFRRVELKTALQLLSPNPPSPHGGTA